MTRSLFYGVRMDYGMILSGYLRDTYVKCNIYARNRGIMRE